MELYSMKMDLQDAAYEGTDWIHLGTDTVQNRVLVKMLMNMWVK
jgi:hypothetical protein